MANKMLFVKEPLLLLVKNNEGDSGDYKVKCIWLTEKVNIDSEGEKCERHLSVWTRCFCDFLLRITSTFRKKIWPRWWGFVHPSGDQIKVVRETWEKQQEKSPGS